MAVALSATPLRLTDANGTILAGAKMYVYLAGTTTQTPCYTTSALSVAHANPLVADSGGLFDEAFFAPGDYKLTFKTSADVSLWEIDNYTVEASGAEINFPVFSKTANFSVTSTDRGAVFLVDASAAPGSNINCTADSDELGSGFPFTVVSVGATGQCTVQGDGAQTVSGAANSIVSVQNAAVSYVSIGATGWQITSKDGVTASTTEALTGTNTTLAVTPNALAALWEKGSDIAGASTITIGEGGLQHVTGSSWACTDIDFTVATNGRSVILVFDGAGVFTHNGTTLLCPGGNDLRVRAGSRCRVTQDAADNVIISDVAHATISSGCDFLETQSASSSAQIDISLVAWPEYTHFEIIISNLIPANNNISLWMRTSSDSGSSFDSGATDYLYYANNAWVLTSANGFNSAGAAQIVITDNVGNVAGEYVDAKIIIKSPTATRNATFRYEVEQRNQTSGNLQQHIAVAERTASQDVTNVRFLMSSGNIASGNFRLYGYR